MTLVTQSLINSIINVKYQYTAATDHASIILELGTDIERQGKGTFRAPPFIQNNREYSKMIQDCTIDAQMRCKTASYQKEAMITLINYRRTTQKIHDDLAENPWCGYPEPWREN